MTTVPWGGNSHEIPPNRAPKGWGAGVTAFLLDLAAKAIPTTGGNQILTGELNFGANFGIVAPYFKSSSSNIAATGVIRFANNEGLGFRDAANGADLIFKVNASDQLEFNGSVIQTAGSKLSAFAATTSAELAGVITDETGSGSLVFANSPTLVTPTLGAASATSINKLAITAPAVGSTLTIADGKTLTASNTLTFAGTDGSSVAFGAGGTVAYVANKLSAFAATTSAELAGVISDETGSGALVFGTSPTIGTPIISGAQRLNNISTPSTPGSGFIEFYSKNDKPTYLDSSGNERVVANTADSLSNPMTTSGDIIYGGASGAATRLAGNSTTTRKFLTQTGSGSASAAPVWNAIQTSDLPITLVGGRWSPSAVGAGITNVAAVTFYSCHYIRVGNIVSCSGFMNVDPTTAASLPLTRVRMPLPIASTLTAFEDVAGTVVGQAAAGTNYQPGIVGWSTGSNAEFFFNCTDAGNNNYCFTFQYEVK